MFTIAMPAPNTKPQKASKSLNLYQALNLRGETKPKGH
jgi:hypothetical protein